MDKDVSLRVGIAMHSSVSGYTLRSLLEIARTVPKLGVDMEAGSFTAPARCRIAGRAVEFEDDYLLFVDSDMSLPTDALEKLYLGIKDNPEMGAISGHYVKRDGSGVSIANWMTKEKRWMEQKQQDKKVFKYMKKKTIAPVDVFGAGCLLIDVKALKKVEFPPFNTAFIMNPDTKVAEFATEDHYFLQRLQQAGYKPCVHFGVLAGHQGEILFWPKAE